MRRIFHAAAIAAILASTATAAPVAGTGVILRNVTPARPVWRIPEPSTVALVALALLSVVRLRP